MLHKVSARGVVRDGHFVRDIRFASNEGDDAV